MTYLPLYECDIGLILSGKKTQYRIPADVSLTDFVSVVRCENHPFSRTALAGTPGEPHGVEDQLVWVAYDWVENPVGYSALSMFKSPLGLPGDLVNVTDGEYVRIKNVEVHYLNDITEEQAIAEGFQPITIRIEGTGVHKVKLDLFNGIEMTVASAGGGYITAKEQFQDYWASIYGDTGPRTLVWSIEFERFANIP